MPMEVALVESVFRGGLLATCNSKAHVSAAPTDGMDPPLPSTPTRLFLYSESETGLSAGGGGERLPMPMMEVAGWLKVAFARSRRLAPRGWRDLKFWATALGQKITWHYGWHGHAAACR